MPFNNSVVLCYLYSDVLYHRGEYLSENPSFNLNFILANPKNHWKWELILSRLSKDELEEVGNNHSNFLHNIKTISNPNITKSFIQKNPIYARYYNITNLWYPIDDIIQDIKNGSEVDMTLVSKNKHLTIHHILNNSNFNWERGEISMHPNILFDDIMQNKSLGWTSYFMYNPNNNTQAAKSFILSQLDIPWDWSFASLNIPLSTEEFIKYKFTDFFPQIVMNTKNSKHEIKKMQQHISYRIPSSFASRSDVIFEEILDLARHFKIVINAPLYEGELKYLNFNSALSSNPNLTWKIIYNNPLLSWDWDALACNPMNRQPAATTIQRAWRKHYRRRVIAATTIQQHWRSHAYSSGPMYKKAKYSFNSLV